MLGEFLSKNKKAFWIILTLCLLLLVAGIVFIQKK